MVVFCVGEGVGLQFAPCVWTPVMDIPACIYIYIKILI